MSGRMKSDEIYNFNLIKKHEETTKRREEKKEKKIL